MLRDAGIITFADTFDLETGEFISSETIVNKGPHPEADSDFTLFCEGDFGSARLGILTTRGFLAVTGVRGFFDEAALRLGASTPSRRRGLSVWGGPDAVRRGLATPGPVGAFGGGGLPPPLDLAFAVPFLNYLTSVGIWSLGHRDDDARQLDHQTLGNSGSPAPSDSTGRPSDEVAAGLGMTRPPVFGWLAQYYRKGGWTPCGPTRSRTTPPPLRRSAAAALHPSRR